ncbi:MAG: DUF4118 domain-containing protein [Terriglobales bacterium]
MKTVLKITKPIAGVLLCAAAALPTAAFTAAHPWHGFVPLGFVVVIVFLSARYGVLVSLFGSAAAALVFAYFYSPLGSLRVQDPMERNSLAWMLLGSIVLSFLLWPPQPHSK